MPPTLAAVVLARNSERTLARCLESLQGVVDRCYVLDTGSEDGTLAISRRFGCAIHEIEWPGRFDVAVNALLDLVQEDWTLRIDSDEWLLPGAAEAIRASLHQPVDLYFLMRVDLHADGSTSEMAMPRLTRTQCGLRVQGRIHEHFSLEDLESVRVADLEASFGHDGFAEASPAKLQRNIALLKEELAEHPDSLYYAIELGRTLMQRKEPEGIRIVSDLADRLLAMQGQDEMPDPLCGDLLAAALDLVPDGDLASLRTDGLIRLARGWCSRLPVTTWAVAQIQLRRKRLREAMDCLLDLEDMLVLGNYDRWGAFQRGTLEHATWHNLALVAHQLGRREVARRNYERWLAVEPLNEQARQNLSAL